MMGSRATKYTPSGYRSAASAATWRARRVLPVPPGPVRVTSRLAASSSSTSATSRWRPRNEVSWSGRLFGVASRVRGGGKSAGSPSIGQLPQVLRAGEVLEPMLTEVGEADAGRQAPGRDGLGCAGHQHLAAVAGCRDARGAVDVQSNVVVAAERPLAGVEAHPDPDAHPLRPGLGGQCALRRAGRDHRVRRGGKDREEGVPFGAELGAVGGRDRLAEECVVALENWRDRRHPATRGGGCCPRYR